MKRKIILFLAAVASVLGFTFATTTPAQAFPTISYTANCPNVASYQQLVIRNYSGATITVRAENPQWSGQFYIVANAAPSTTGAITYVPVMYRDVVTYLLSGSGNLNWYYHVDCFYR